MRPGALIRLRGWQAVTLTTMIAIVRALDRVELLLPIVACRPAL